jgi:hypothetical protein
VLIQALHQSVQNVLRVKVVSVAVTAKVQAHAQVLHQNAVLASNIFLV